MSRPKHTRQGALGVARLTKSKYICFVEGKEHDAVYYERLLDEDPVVRKAGVYIFRISEISKNDSTDLDPEELSAGGKSAVLDFYNYCHSKVSLTIETKRSRKELVFLLDRDFDDFSSSYIYNPRIIYTYGTDVEAEIYRQGDIGRSLQTVLSLTRQEAIAAEHHASDYFVRLANTWREWIYLCAATEPLRSRCAVRPSRPSVINLQKYGELSEVLREKHYEQLMATSQVPSPEDIFMEVQRKVDEAFEAGHYWRLLKGKLLGDYIMHLISDMYSLSERDKSIKANQLTLQMLETCDFSDQIAFFKKRFDSLDLQYSSSPR